jgi:L-rhamnose-H+ transport protein
MGEHAWLGMAIISLSGILNGGFPLPMKYSRRWKWENTWLVYALVALLILPWSLAVEFTPALKSAYGTAPTQSVLLPLAFGLLWGIAQVTFGLGIHAVGMALTFAVVMGLASLFGSLIPLLVLSPSDLFRARGVLLLISMPLLLGGLVICGKAGRRREREASKSANPSGQMSFLAGLSICIFTGVFGANLNLGFAFGGGLIRTSYTLGGNAVTATYPLWALVLGAGFIPNLVYCSYLLSRNKTWGLFFGPCSRKEAIIGIAMGILWLAGIVCYGIGATLAGRYGPSLGFALFMATSILASNMLGLLTGEWRLASSGTKRLLAKGVGVILVSVVLLNLGGIFS